MQRRGVTGRQGADPYEYAKRENKPVGDGGLDIPLKGIFFDIYVLNRYVFCDIIKKG